MQLCLMIEGQEDVTWSQWVGLARACEEHGVPALFRSDHYMNLDGQHPERVALDAWATVCALAAVTTSVRLGTMVSPITFRHPSNLAKLAASADHISGGRVEVGIGAGWHEREHEAYGFAFPPTAERVELLEEQLRILLGNWGDERFDFAGRHYRLRDLDARPKPFQRPHPPLIIGGNAGRRSVALAAAYADEYNTAFPTEDDVRARRQRIVEACSAAGREPIPFSIMTTVLVGRDAGELRERAGRLLERAGLDQSVDGFLATPPPAWIVGTVEQAVERLNVLREAGANRVMCQHLLHDDLAAVELLGRELAPQLA